MEEYEKDPDEWLKKRYNPDPVSPFKYFEDERFIGLRSPPIFEPPIKVRVDPHTGTPFVDTPTYG